MASGQLLPKDWLVGATAMKGNGTYLRNMLDPTADKYSRDHVSQIACADEDIHRASGIFNKVTNI
jgi:Zn-dependent metalloprotease